MKLRPNILSVFVGALACLMVCCAGCLPSPHYQKTVSPPHYAWKADYKPSFRFEISDTNSVYNLYFLIRHTEVYPFSNIWIKIYTKEPGAKQFDASRIEIPLAEASGKWLGRGMGDIWEHRMPITRNDAPMRFTKAGMYEIRLEQCMRVDPLPEILQIGLRVEQAGKRIR